MLQPNQVQWCRLWRRPSTLPDYSALVTSTLLCIALPPYAPWWLIAIGVASSLLLANNLERLGVISSGVMHWARLNHDVVNGDARGVEKTLEKVDFHRKQMSKIASLIKSTLDGSVQKVKKEIKADIDRFFDARYGSTMKQVVETVRAYRMPLERYEYGLGASGFTYTLYLFYQDFKEYL